MQIDHCVIANHVLPFPNYFRSNIYYTTYMAYKGL